MNLLLLHLAVSPDDCVKKDAGFERGGVVAEPLREPKLDAGFNFAWLGVDEYLLPAFECLGHWLAGFLGTGYQDAPAMAGSPISPHPHDVATSI